jgi:uncharacterized protein
VETIAMETQTQNHCTAFAGTTRIASGRLADVALKVKEVADQGTPVLIFDDQTSDAIEVDLRGSAADVLARLAGAGAVAEDAGPPAPRGPGRPRLGVVAREVTLLPRHWEWLNGQPGGASVALRKLVEAARREHSGVDRVRQSQNASYKFMAAMAGDLPGFEEAIRALFAAQRERFEGLLASWPADIRDHARKLAAEALA